MYGGAVASSAFFVSFLAGCLGERVSVHLADFGADGVSDVSSAAGKASSASSPDVSKPNALALGVIQKFGPDAVWKDFPKERFYEQLLVAKHHKCCSAADHLANRKTHKAAVFNKYKVIINKYARQTLQKEMLYVEEHAQSEQDRAAQETAFRATVSNFVDFQVAALGAKLPGDADMQPGGGLPFTRVSFDDIMALLVGGAAEYKQALEAGLLSAEVGEDAAAVFSDAVAYVRAKRENALFECHWLSYGGDVAPFEASGYAVSVAYFEVGCGSAPKCTFEDKVRNQLERQPFTMPGAMKGELDTDSMWDEREMMIGQANAAQAQSGLPFKFVITSSGEAPVDAGNLHDQPTEKAEAESYDLSYKA